LNLCRSESLHDLRSRDDPADMPLRVLGGMNQQSDDGRGHCGIRQPSPAACAIKYNPAAATTAPMARATRSPAGARRSTVPAEQ
jgi:hypothetical protein